MEGIRRLLGKASGIPEKKTFAYMKKKGGYLPETWEDEEEDAEFRRRRRFYRQSPMQRKRKRWEKRNP